MKLSKNKLLIIAIIIIVIVVIFTILIFHKKKESYINKPNIISTFYVDPNHYMKGKTKVKTQTENFIQEKETEKETEVSRALLSSMKAASLTAKQVPDIEPMPFINILNSDTYDTESAIYCAYLVKLAYYLNSTIPEYSFINHEIAKNLLTNEIQKTTSYPFKIIDLLLFTCNTPLSSIIKSYGGFILEVEYGGKSVIFIIIRGTVNTCEWFEDGKAILMSPYWASNIKVHTGFNNIYTNENYVKYNGIRETLYDYFTTGKAYYANNISPKNLNNTSKIIISGHSLGGGVVNLMTADMAKNFIDLRQITKIFTFAAPYTGNNDFATLINTVQNRINDSYSGLFSIINLMDLVPTVGAIYYVRPKYQNFYFSAGYNVDIDTTKLANAHLMPTYLNGIKYCKNKFDLAKTYYQKNYCGYDLGLYLNEIKDLSFSACESNKCDKSSESNNFKPALPPTYEPINGKCNGFDIFFPNLNKCYKLNRCSEYPGYKYDNDKCFVCNNNEYPYPSCENEICSCCSMTAGDRPAPVSTPIPTPPNTGRPNPPSSGFKNWNMPRGDILKLSDNSEFYINNERMSGILSWDENRLKSLYDPTDLEFNGDTIISGNYVGIPIDPKFPINSYPDIPVTPAPYYSNSLWRTN